MSSALVLSLVMTDSNGWLGSALAQEKEKASEEEQDKRKKRREERGKGEGQGQPPPQQQRQEQQQQRQDAQKAGQDAQNQREQARKAREDAQQQREQAKAAQDAQRQQQAGEKQQREQAKAAQDAAQKQREQTQKAREDAQGQRQQAQKAREDAQKQREDAARAGQKQAEDAKAERDKQKQRDGRAKTADDPPKQGPGQPPLGKQPAVAVPSGAPPKQANEQQDPRARFEAERLQRKDEREKADAARKDVRDDRKDARDDRKDARDDRKDDRKDARDDRKDDRRDDRKDARGDRKDDRKDPRDDRKEAREDRKDDRQDRRQDNRLERVDDRLKKLEEVKSERRERVEGGRTIIEEPGNRKIIREKDRVIIQHDESQRFKVLYRDARTERRRDGTSVTFYRRPDGAQIFTVLDDNGLLIRRYRRTPQGREFAIIDNTSFFRPGRPRGLFDVVINLPPPVISIPRRKYIVDYSDSSPDEIYEALSAPPVERLDRAYSLEEVRRSQPLRERMRRIDLDAITFEFGAFEVSNDQFPKLERIADGINRVLRENPDEVFMIEGHTDAVGSDVDNLTLSDRRAESVALILSQEFRVPPENLTTQGYGEQFLKVPTEEPERLNRRVAVRRITPLLSQSN